MPHRGQPAGHTGGFKAAGVEIGEIVAQRLGLGIHECMTDPAQKFREIAEVAAVGIERVGAGALFRGEHVEEQADELGV
ncbi:hypothetical protein ABH992_003372 [Bradyrhizobium yuanmingense]|uniref:Uncharacterized protein n=1 Tax=Bradyrhizobium yuanmingense TaxID=108015 RepID=A0ABV4GG93_9BRAD